MIELKMTCEACPEQYNAYFGDIQVGYLSLRHGLFTVECPDYRGELVYRAPTNGDGCFDDNEREKHLAAAEEEIMEWLLHQ